MLLFLVLIVLVVIGGIVVRTFFLPRGSKRRDDADVTDRDEVPPVEPQDPVPGSEPHRRDQGMP